MTIHQAYQQLLFQLFEIYDDSEAHTIADWVMEHITEWKRIDRIVNKEFSLSAQKQERLEKYTKELRAHRPVQYVLGEAWFAGMKFYVNEKVLIPRPETEELVEWIVKEVASSEWRVASKNKVGSEQLAASTITTNDPQLITHNSQLSIIDIGTGSGCIPIALKKKLPQAEITAIDVCSEALSIAVENAVSNETEIDFKLLDFLDRNKWNEPGQFDIIVSNPPYVKSSEANEMRRGVLDFEPSLALFVPDDDALIFYKQIADFALTHLKPCGMIFMEINEALGNETVALFKEKKITNVELKKDIQGKNRMVKAVL
ncbi:MAG: peptide chain release factor N(5)-glutamine methyltransferase [Sphingobacteriales bacterium]|nr:peptide chain release factor N(5)-glutamine methyltransferase [Sphingobacteriales bacterium]MBI3718746.1 peptide chain release factor N(5)-glutamine methyltransferase [Sphingobacteriales bacterium]